MLSLILVKNKINAIALIVRKQVKGDIGKMIYELEL